MVIMNKFNFKSITKSNYWILVKWSLMAVSIFWMIVFLLSEQAAQVPEFVYVNF